MLHRNAPLSGEGRRRLVERCQTRPIAHVAAEMGIYCACASEWVTCFREFGKLGLLDRASVPHYPPTATPTSVVARMEKLRRDKRWSARRIAHELSSDGTTISVRTVSRHLALECNRRKFLDPTGESNRVNQGELPAGRGSWCTWM
ncbi:transposase [Rhodococcus opacus M213]|uniref:Transposase n=1 Tax=Rhodococcus opacus M213 TaxID=1129896 RepID=K8XIB5_RHOOP|nr:transposase [Rhodococcus opacus M213]